MACVALRARRGWRQLAAELIRQISRCRTGYPNLAFEFLPPFTCRPNSQTNIYHPSCTPDRLAPHWSALGWLAPQSQCRSDFQAKFGYPVRYLDIRRNSSMADCCRHTTSVAGGLNDMPLFRPNDGGGDEEQPVDPPKSHTRYGANTGDSLTSIPE
jgi:hypothetical protein